jgi:hypothetical protein
MLNLPVRQTKYATELAPVPKSFNVRKPVTQTLDLRKGLWLLAFLAVIPQRIRCSPDAGTAAPAAIQDAQGDRERPRP